MTTVYEAIMRAADHIERNPGEFKFVATEIPVRPGCGTPGCALGWIGCFLDMRAGTSLFVGHERVPERLGIEPTQETIFGTATFYARMKDLCFSKSDAWAFDAKMCADTLREYAEKYHAPRDLIPAGVREIFSRTYTARDLTV